MGNYKTAQVCLNGHIVTDDIINYPELSETFCSKCGAKTITICPNCNAPIHGDYYVPGVISLCSVEAPDSYCYNCGKPYPWTESAIETTKLLILEEEEFSEQLKASIVESLQDVIVETPRTNLATVRLKKGLASAGKFTAEAIRQFVIDFGCEFAKKSLGL